MELNCFSQKIVYVSISIILATLACTKLEIDNGVDILTDDFFKSEEDFVRFISPAYISLRSYTSISSVLALQEISTDEICIPVRGNDWYEDGHWQRLHRQEWLPRDAAINGTWSFLFEGVNQCNRLIKALEELNVENTENYIAELCSLRAIYYLWLLDLFGNVPIVKSYDFDKMPETSSRQEVFEFVKSELRQNLDYLPKEVTPTTYGRVNYFVAQTTLALLYLNQEVYIGTPNWQEVISHCDIIIQSGNYAMESDYFKIFSTENQNSTEMIFAIPYDAIAAQGFNVSMFTLHAASQKTYNLTSQPWNGWCTLADFFASYDSADLRKGNGVNQGSLIYGQQYTDIGDTLFEDTTGLFLAEIDPDGLALNYTPEIRSLDSAYQQDGARIGKFEIRVGSGQEMDNDFPIFRYTKVLMMKAEALWRLGNSNESLLLLNQVRKRSGLPDLIFFTEEELLAELGREFFMEAHRRTDLIRFGKFKNSWWEKPVSDDCKNLFPIPEMQLEVNANLNQNPCY